MNMMIKQHQLLNTYTLVLVLVLFLFFSYLASSLNTLKAGDFLNSSSQLVSPNKLFTLGFYTPESNLPNSNNTYLAIQFNGQNHPIWIGNRNMPLANNSALLTINSLGNLIITNFNQTSVFIDLYSTQTSTNVTATLLDSGNFVLTSYESGSGSAVGGKVLWQSFDYPTDTLLPGMKLGVNHRTGLNWTLTSWFSSTSPRDGAFTLEWDTMTLRLIVRHRGVIYWTSGLLKNGIQYNGQKYKVFDFFKPDPANFNYNFTSESNKDEDYFSYNLKKTSFVDYRNTISGWELDFLGTVSDQDRGAIAPVDLCYGFNNTGDGDFQNDGCELREQPKCRSSTQKFTLRSGGFRKRESNGDVGIFDGLVRNNSNLSLSDCREICWKDCKCAGYAGYDEYGCTIWSLGPNYVEFQQDVAGYTSRKYVLDKAQDKRGRNWRKIVIAVVVPVPILLFGLLCYVNRKIRQGKAKKLLELSTLDGYTNTSVLENDGQKGQDLKLLSYSCIVASTNSFSSENKLGEGGFGPVYKGKLPGGKEIAVKRLSRRSGQGLHEFKTELILIAKLQHTNLVRLFGCCIHGEEKMLVYEYMPNGSLDFFLFDQTKRMELSWNRRFIIIEGIAQGLLYLHRYSRLRIVHRDLKPSNILLDENMNPKISDFGTARISNKNLAEESTNKITGTRGYMAPEYLMEGTFSVKSDVYSFGILMLEILSGRKNNSFHDVEGPLSLVAHAWELWNRNAAIQLIDPALHGSSTIYDQLLRCIHIGLLCVQNNAVDRPTISDVISMLSSDITALPLPKLPAFVTGPAFIEENPGRTKSPIVSKNGLSISDMEAR